MVICQSRTKNKKWVRNRAKTAIQHSNEGNQRVNSEARNSLECELGPQEGNVTKEEHHRLGFLG